MVHVKLKLCVGVTGCHNNLTLTSKLLKGCLNFYITL